MAETVDTIKENDVIQIKPGFNNTAGCLLIVDSIKKWGVKAYFLLPHQPGAAYYNFEWDDFIKIGTAKFIFGVSGLEGAPVEPVEH